MARTTLAVTTVTRTGVARPAGTTGIADGHKITNTDGRVWLEIDNANASPRTLTLQTPAMLGPYNIEDHSIVVPGSAVAHHAGPFETAYFTRPNGVTDAGMMYLDYPVGQHADITVRAFKI